MIITNFNQMSVEELQIIAQHICVEFQINYGRIVGTVEKSAE